MKYLDEVKVIVEKDIYKKEGIKKNSIGTIILPEIRNNKFEIEFYDKNGIDYAQICVCIEDLELVHSSDLSDEELLEALPQKNPNWWCKVEDGYILNLKNEKKNKIPYKY